MSISVASMRPLPLTIPAGRSEPAKRCQAQYPNAASATAETTNSHDRLVLVIASLLQIGSPSVLEFGFLGQPACLAGLHVSD